MYKNPKYDRHQHGLTSVVHKFFDKKWTATHANKFASSSTQSGAGTNSKHQQLAEELHKLTQWRFQQDSDTMDTVSAPAPKKIKNKKKKVYLDLKSLGSALSAFSSNLKI